LARPLNILTARKVAALKDAGRHADGGGLYLRITDAGSKSWVFMTTADKKRLEIGLGAVSGVRLATARMIAADMRDAVAMGNDPRAVLIQTATSMEPEKPLFGDFADRFVAGLINGWKHDKHKQQWKNTLTIHAASLRSKRIDLIATDDVLEVLRPIWTTIPEQASKLRGRIERILDAAAAAGHRDPDKRNPATWKRHLEHFLPKQKRGQHHKAVPWRDMPNFWKSLSERRSSSSVSALRFTILNATRTAETTGAQRCEFDLDERKWTIPAARMKEGVAHEIPLTTAAMAVLHAMKIDELGTHDFIFPGASRGDPLSNMAMLVLLQNEMNRSATVHGFRSTFRDWAGDATHHSREIVEMALSHAVGDSTERAYRRTRAFEKRRTLMDDWVTYLVSKVG
jgi:integrase